MPEVLNLRNGIPKSTPTSIYVGRPTMWGNPFVIGEDGTREEVVAKYERYIKQVPLLLSMLPQLKGKDLTCWCAPESCHADILLRLANKEGT